MSLNSKASIKSKFKMPFEGGLKWKVLASLLLLSIVGFGQRIPLSKPVIVKVTSTECNICGLKAWDEFKDVIDKYEEDAVIMAIHPLELSHLFSETALTYSDNLTTFWGTPTLYINDEFSFNGWSKEVSDFLQLFQERQVTVHPFIKYTIQGDQLEVEVETQFFKKSNRPHYLSVYVVEDKVVADQSNRGPEDLHSKVLRTHLGEAAMGTLLSETDITENQKFFNDFSITIDPSWKSDNLEIAAIVWEKRGDQYHVINSNIALEPNLSTSINVLEAAQVSMQVQPTILVNNSMVQLELPIAQEDLNLRVVNTLGQAVKTIFTGDLSNGQHYFTLDKADYLESGMYFLVLEKNGDKLVKKMMVK